MRSLGSFDLELAERPGRAKRTARLSVSVVRVWIQAPQRPGHGQGFHPPVPCTVVRVFESPEPVPGEGLEWILLCRHEVRTFEQAVECAAMYSTRWLIEDFHKGLKTGLGAERLQLETGKRLMAAVALMSVVAVRLIRLREFTRINPQASAQSLDFTDRELRILEIGSKLPVQTVGQIARALGRLGGHLGRKSDGMPGWITLWRGMKKLTLLVQGARIGQQLQGFG
jgi:hypothetical protein